MMRSLEHTNLATSMRPRGVSRLTPQMGTLYTKACSSWGQHVIMHTGSMINCRQAAALSHLKCCAQVQRLCILA